MEIELTLKNEKIKAYRWFAAFIVSANAVYFLFLLFNREQRQFGEIAVGTLAAYMVYRFLRSRKENIAFHIDEWIFFVLMMLWVHNYFFAIVNLVFMLQYTAATQPIIFSFSEEIKQKNFPWKKYRWDEIANVILKDSILTMDFKNNRMIQGEIENDVDETEFNLFINNVRK